MLTHFAVLAAVTAIVVWLCFLAVIWHARPENLEVMATLRLVPDCARLLRRLAADRRMPRSTRALPWLLLAYLALPIDLVPDFIPILGYADDLILIALVLRHLIRRAGPDLVRAHWPGTPEGLTALAALCRLPDLATPPA